MVTCHCIQGRYHDIGVLCGTLPSMPVTESTKKKLYTIYRYLNVMHILCMKSFSPSLKELNDELHIFVTPLNLLIEDELLAIAGMENRAMPGMITMLFHEIDDLILTESGSKRGDMVLVPKSRVLHKKNALFVVCMRLSMACSYKTTPTNIPCRFPFLFTPSRHWCYWLVLWAFFKGQYMAFWLASNRLYFSRCSFTF